MADPTALVLAIFGGAGTVGGLFGWLGKLQANRILEGERAKHSLELERLRSDLSRQEKVSGAAFEMYSALWSTLQDVKLAGDALWDHADLTNLEAFRVALRHARIAIDRGRILLDEHHYRQLQSLLKAFGDYEVGKERLISIGSAGALQDAYAREGQFNIERQIRANDFSRTQYSGVLEDLLPRFRRKLGVEERQ